MFPGKRRRRPDFGDDRNGAHAPPPEDAVMPAQPALYERFRSRETHSFGDRMLSAMRKEFGGHVETKGER